jgi:hypothetical protein
MRAEPQQLLGELNQLLWRQRDVLSDVVYRLEVQQLLLVDGRDRWVDRSVEDLERALERVERYQRMQRDLLDELSVHLPVQGGSRLSEVVSVVPSPWDGILEEQQAALLVLITEIESASRDNVGLVRRGMAQVEEVMQQLGRAGGGSTPGAQTYGPTGERGLRRPDAMLLDRQV